MYRHMKCIKCRLSSTCLLICAFFCCKCTSVHRLYFSPCCVSKQFCITGKIPREYSPVILWDWLRRQKWKSSGIHFFRDSLWEILRKFFPFPSLFLTLHRQVIIISAGGFPLPVPFLWEGKSVGGVENFFIKPVSVVDRGGAGKSTHLLKKSNLPLSPPAPPTHLHFPTKRIFLGKPFF